MEDQNNKQYFMMNETDGSNSNGSSYKRKLDEKPCSNDTDQPSKFKKARFPWQIKGISVERNIISREVTIDENDPKHMVGLLRYEEKGVVEVDLSNSASCSDFLPDVRAPRPAKGFGNEVEEESQHEKNTENVHESEHWKDCKKQVHSVLNENMSLDQDIELENDSQSSMDHEMSAIQNQREEMTGVNPTFSFQQCVWQKREMGCAIVDNVFNKTLEEMGLSPDPKVNQFATDRLKILQQGIDAAINHQGLFTQSDHSIRSHGSDRVPKQSDISHHDPMIKRRLSLEDIPTTSNNSKRRLSQPLCGYGMKYRSSEHAHNEDRSAMKLTEDCRADTSEDMNNNNDIESLYNAGGDNRMLINSNQVAVDTNISDISDQNTMEHIQYDDTSVQNNDTSNCQNLCNSGESSENLLDLAVSTAIKSQGLSL